MIRKTLKWIGIIVLVLVLGVTLVTTLMQYKTYEAPYPNITASKDSLVIARGRHLALGPAHCTDCHSTIRNHDSLQQIGKDAPLSGGNAFHLPLGTFYTPNITPDKETGIGNLTDGEVARVLRHGISSKGSAVLPFMPYQNLSDEDLTAIVSYLRSLEPVRNEVPKHEYTVMGRIIKAFLLKPGGPTEPTPKAVVQDTSAAYGRYLVMTVGNCNGCHTKRDEKGTVIGASMAGGVVFEEPGLPTLVTPNLTQHPTGRTWKWTQEDFIRRFRAGRTVKHSHMPWEAYNRMSDDELKAIYNYLQTVKPAPTETAPVAEKG